jgi:hypothetical protein
MYPTTLPAFLSATMMRSFLVRLDLGKDVHANHAVQQGAVAQRLQVRPDEDLRARQARLPADAGRYQAIVPRDDL